METASFITVIGMWMLLIFGGMTIFFTYRHRRAALEMNHRERMSALEHGFDLPAVSAEDAQMQAGQRAQYLHRGVVCIVVGVALMLALAVNVGWASAAWAGPLVGFGVACLIVSRLLGRQGGGA